MCEIDWYQKMNDLDLCLERSYQGHVNHCVTFDVEYLRNS